MLSIRKSFLFKHDYRLSDCSSVLMKGCLGHFGHDCDVRKLPMPQSLRNVSFSSAAQPRVTCSQEICTFLRQGLSEDEVLGIIKGEWRGVR